MIDAELSRRIQRVAIEQLTPRERLTSWLYIDEEPVRRGTRLGPGIQGIVVEDDSVLVFVDDDPRANFGHACRYLLFDSVLGRLRRMLAARFPPYLRGTPRSYRRFAASVERERRPPPIVARPLPTPVTPALIQGVTTGRRCAVLFCGNPDISHLNDMEFAYRVLIQRFDFDPALVKVLNYNGTLTTTEWGPSVTAPQTNWPGDGKPYLTASNVTGRGIGDDMARTLQQFGLQPDDLLLIHTTGHGDGVPGGDVYIATEMDEPRQYTATQFGDDLAALPQCRHLIVVMQHCCSGGFEDAVINRGKADHISFAAAASSMSVSYKTDDLLWDCFARDWFAAQRGSYPDGSALKVPADTGPYGVPDQRISADEAFVYSAKVKDPDDLPQYASTGPTADGTDLN